jgi:serine protein kinase
MLKAIGEPKAIDTRNDPRLSRIFANKVIKVYPAFAEFYGMEEVIERLVAFFRHAAQGLEESRQILYLLGPVGSAKSSLAERLKELMEQEPFYALADENGTISPVNESPLGLFTEDQADELGIPKRYLSIRPSPWALKRTEEYEGDISRFKVVKVFPSRDRQIGISKTEPGDENNQDISTLVGKLDIRKLEFFAQNDPDAYNYSGGLCLSNQGILEFVEMFKAPIKVLHPLLTATQERNYKGTEAISALPFDGIILAHSNESEWSTFKNDSNNEAFLDRVYIVEVPYCLRVDEEVRIYTKLLASSDLKNAPTAPKTLEMLAKFCVATRLDRPENSHLESKLFTYNGESVKDRDNKAKSYHEYKELACRDEGFFGVSTRLAYKILSEVYNFDPEEVAADPVHLMFVIDSTIKKERYPKDKETLYLDFLQKLLAARYHQDLTKDIQTAYLESYSEYGQALFDRYILFADHWIQDNDYRDPDTGNMFDRAMLNGELEKIEKPAGIANPKDFRNEIVNFALRHQARYDGKNPKWTAYEKLRRVIETTMFNKTEDLLPIISFGQHGTTEEKKKHVAFVERMKELGYTERQVKRLVEWHLRMSKN